MKHSTISKAFFVMWAMQLLLGLGVTGAILYVAWHFIAKFW